MLDPAPPASGLGIVFLLSMILIMWSLPRRFAILPLFLTTAYIPLTQAFVLAGLNLQFFRILLLAGWLRVFLRSEHTSVKWETIDQLFTCWLAVTLILGAFTQPAPFADRLINRVGEVFNAGATYFLIRCWVRSFDEVLKIVYSLALFILPLAAFMLVERFTSRNVFSVFGGVPEYTVEQEGRLRCQGAFRHAILAGTYGATLFPLFCGLWWAVPRARRRAAIGMLCSIVITISGASSGALLALLSGCLGFYLWRHRKHMRTFRLAFLLALSVLALGMQAPVWYLFAKASNVVGGNGWYRSFLIDQAVQHFDEWWLKGTRYTAHWAPGGETPPGNPDNTDIVNHYVAEGLDGGILKLALFSAIIVQCYRTVGKLTQSHSALPLTTRKMVWAWGICLTSHCVSFFSVVYFDQIIVMWYWTLAAIATLQRVAPAASPLQTLPAELPESALLLDPPLSRASAAALTR